MPAKNLRAVRLLAAGWGAAKNGNLLPLGNRLKKTALILTPTSPGVGASAFIPVDGPGPASRNAVSRPSSAAPPLRDAAVLGGWRNVRGPQLRGCRAFS